MAAAPPNGGQGYPKVRSLTRRYKGLIGRESRGDATLFRARNTGALGQGRPSTRA
jgi:hypothetical protein